MLNFEEIHKRIYEKQSQLNEWHDNLRKSLPIPIYTSIDVRDSGFKIASVDANIYPAGFNNICDTDREAGHNLAKSYLQNTYGKETKNIILITEEHTNNAYYWQNVYALRQILIEADYNVEIALPRKMESIEVQTANGQTLQVHGSYTDESGNLFLENGFQADLVLTNNDFSDQLSEWASNLKTPLNPPREMGWFQRKKSTHFEFYNEIAGEFADILEVPKESFQIYTEVFDNFDISDEDSKTALAKRVDEILADLSNKYQELGIDSSPSVFVKNNSGTYGLAVNKVNSGSEIMEWNYKSRKKMKAAKGGKDVSSLIIQEGIPSRIKVEEAVAEPVVYLMGCKLLGGFLRTHSKKGENDSLNSPGAAYKRLCMSDLLIHSEKVPMENVYGWIGRISSLAIGKEIQKAGVQFTSTECE